MRQLPAQYKEDRQTLLPAEDSPLTLYSVLLPERFSGHTAALHLRYSFLSFSRATSVQSPYPRWGTPESFTPSAGFRRFPTDFVCRYLITGDTLPRFFPDVNARGGKMSATWRHFPNVPPALLVHDGSSSLRQKQAGSKARFPPVRPTQRPTMMFRISWSVFRMPSRARRPTLPMVFSTPFWMIPSPPTNWCPPCIYIW